MTISEQCEDELMFSLVHIVIFLIAPDTHTACCNAVVVLSLVTWCSGQTLTLAG